VYCNRSCLWFCGFVRLKVGMGVCGWECVCVRVFVCLWVCYHDNSKLHASIFTKLSLYVKIVTISSWLNFWPSRAPEKGVCGGAKFLAPPYYSQRQCLPLSERFFSVCIVFPLDEEKIDWLIEWINEYTIKCTYKVTVLLKAYHKQQTSVGIFRR